MSKPLTPQELWVMYYLHNNLSNSEIASAMELSKNTVKVHKFNLYKKLALTGLTKAQQAGAINAFVSTWPDLFEGLFPEVDADH